MMTHDPEALSRDYVRGTPFPRMSAAHGMTVHEIQEFAFERGLVYGSLQAEGDPPPFVSPSDRPRLLEGTVVGRPPDRPPDRPPQADYRVARPVEGDLAAVEDPDENRYAETRDRGRNAVDDLYDLQGLHRRALRLDITSAVDPENYHPARRDVIAARSLRGPKETVADALKKATESALLLVTLDRANEARPDQANGGTSINIDNRSVNVGGGDVTVGNNTAIDPKSKLAGLIGKIELLKERKKRADLEREARETGGA